MQGTVDLGDVPVHEPAEDAKCPDEKAPTLDLSRETTGGGELAAALYHSRLSAAGSDETMLPKKQFKKSISYDEWKARAEAAEKRVAELEAAQARHHDDYDMLYRDYIEIRAMWEGTADTGAELHALRGHIAELEAAAADWHSQAIGIDNMLDDEIRETVALRARVAELEAAQA